MKPSRAADSGPQAVARPTSGSRRLLGARLHAFIQRRRGRGELLIAGYCGYGTSQRALLEGRVLRPRQLGEATALDPRWRNALNVVRRFASREVGGVRVRGAVYGAVAEDVSDEEGYFRLDFRFEEVLADGWHDAALSLPGRAERASAPLRLSHAADFGVISDLDDTVLRTGAAKIWQMFATVALNNALTRLPFPGGAELYRALAGGPDGEASNPVFYVSSSPWNLFDLLWLFLKHNGLPLGPLLLRDWGLDFISGGRKHKLEAIARLFAVYPNLSFVLLGDSGERDPEIYSEVVRRFPGRVRAVYIREVAGHRRSGQVRQLAGELRAHAVDLILAPDTLAAAHHAYALGLIGARGLREVGAAL